ncbi:MAG: gamma-glutamylcyclotransferase family protein [Lentimonas sp.]
MHTEAFTVFVYGTLKPGGHYWHRFCEGKVSRVVAARIRGSLYDLHVGYPGLVLDDGGWVQGFLLTFESLKELEHLDRLEGFDENRPADRNDYLRLKVRCFNEHGESFGEHWSYEMTQGLREQHRCTLIENGEWPV